MNTYQSGKNLFVRRRNAVLALTAFIVFIGIFVVNGPAWSVELDKSSPVMHMNEAKFAILSSPSSVQKQEDSCLPLLKSVRHFSSPPSATDRNRRPAGKAAALGFVFGVRFALGPKEVTKSRNQNRAKFDVWQPRNEGGIQAMAVAEYRRCKNDEALKALSDWRWAR